jgi:hypothetical protein
MTEFVFDCHACNVTTEATVRPMDTAIIVADLSGITHVGFITGDPCEWEMQVYFPPRIAPQPSHGEECPVCLEMTDDLAFKFNCGHLCCWPCTQKWDAASTDVVMTCPICRDATLRPGNYFQGANVEVMRSTDYAILLACSEEIPHLDLPRATIRVVYELSTGWWSMGFTDHAKILDILAVARAEHGAAIDDLARVIQHLCAWCGATDPMACSRCKTTAYCSRKCQKLHWKQHKPTCQAFDLCAVLPSNSATVHWPGDPPLKVTTRSGALILIGVRGNWGGSFRPGARLFARSTPCVAVHVAGLRTVQACVQAIEALLQAAGIETETLVATIIGGGTRVCGDETHEQVLCAFQDAMHALELGLPEPAAFLHLCGRDVLDSSDGVFAGAGLVALCAVYRLRTTRLRTTRLRTTRALGVVFHRGFDMTYTVDAAPLTLRVQPLGMMACTGPILDNPDVGRQVVVIRDTVTLYMSGERLPSETTQALQMKTTMEAEDALRMRAVLDGDPREHAQLFRQMSLRVI